MEPEHHVGPHTVPGYAVHTTRPDFILRHDISDEELDVLTSETRTFMHDVIWGSLGAALGALVPAISAMANLQKKPSSFGNWELLECFVFVAAIAVCAIMCCTLWKEPNVSKVKAIEIRARTRRKQDDDQK